MIINNKLRTLFVLALYIGFTIAIYAIVCHFLKIESNLSTLSFRGQR